MENASTSKSMWLVVAVIFACCVAPTFISYQPYLFRWDDSEYLQRAIAVSRAFWSGDRHGMVASMVSIRPPAMTMLGLPWGSMRSWDSAANCFISLAATASLLAAVCLYLLLRIGVRPVFLVLASVCVFASLGPFPPGSTVHADATGYGADTFFAWTTLAALLLISYETRMTCSSSRASVLRGILWGAIISFGVMTKLDFLYFAVLILPLLFFMMLSRAGLRSALAALIGFACSSAPSAYYLLRHGQAAFGNAKASSFGGVASFYYKPLLPFLGETIRQSPGLLLSFVLCASALIYLLIKRRLMTSWPDLAALLIGIGFVVTVLSAPNRQVRYSFPAIVALPFLVGILMSGKGRPIARFSAALNAAFVFILLLGASVPTKHRADVQSLSRSNAVLSAILPCNAKHIVVATESPTLNGYLLSVALDFSTSNASIETLGYRAMIGVPIEKDFRTMSESDQIIFQDAAFLSPPFANQRVSEYERFIRQSVNAPIRVGNDISVYSLHCRP